jgi:hypothetical protein
VSDYEKLGVFYLGRVFDPQARRPLPEPLLYDAKDLTTHGVCVGMTGSGKTGLCISLLEEAAIDGIPAIAIDPKGDLGNLLLTFPELRPEDFAPWIDPEEAARQGHTPEQHARAVAERWRQGLAEWDQDGSRIARFREAADVALYTPGSRAGLPISVLRSFAAPSPALAADEEALRERVLSAVSGLLALVGVAADPVRSREHILLATLLDRAWRAGRDLDLASLIRELQSPPFERVGVLDLESFFPARERFELALALNNLLASPAFAAWSEGAPLDVARLLHTPEGRPRISILSIAHLSEAERMFFVTILLNEVVAWMRAQPGTQSLRALLYMDEVFGYLPPTANPPSKLPLLTLLKQARAYGLGVLLATQNPVDLDYKALSNAGTWFLGRLQTERDKARVIDGLEGASAASGAAFDRQRLERTLSGLGSRVFLLNDVHEDEPVLFHTRWALSYLRGPLTREQIARLAQERATAAPEPAPAPAAAPAPRPAAAAAASSPTNAERPVVPPKVDETFLSPTPGDGGGALVYRPALLARAQLRYASAKHDLDRWESLVLLAPLADSGSEGAPWEAAQELGAELPPLEAEPASGARFAPLPSAAARPESYERWTKQLTTWLHRERPLRLLRCPELRLVSRQGESEGDFRVRLREALHERRDLELERLRQRYAPRLAGLQERIRSAQAALGREQSQLQQQKMQTAVSVGATLLGALFGRKLGSVGNVGRATTAARSASRVAREREDALRAQEKLATLEAQLADLSAELEAELERVRHEQREEALALDETVVRPSRTDLSVERLALAWTPCRPAPGGGTEPAFRAVRGTQGPRGAER